MEWKTTMSKPDPVGRRAFFKADDTKAAAGSMYVAAAEHEMWGLGDKTHVTLSDQPVGDAAIAVNMELTKTDRELRRQFEYKSGTGDVTLFVRKSSPASRRQTLYLGLSAGAPASQAVREPSKAQEPPRDPVEASPKAQEVRRDPRGTADARVSNLRPLDNAFVIEFTKWAVIKEEGAVFTSRHLWELLARVVGFSSKLEEVDGIKRDQLYRLIRDAVPELPKALGPRRLGGPRGPEKYWAGYTVRDIPRGMIAGLRRGGQTSFRRGSLGYEFSRSRKGKS